MNLFRKIFTPGGPLPPGAFRKMCLFSVLGAILLFLLDYGTKEAVIRFLEQGHRVVVIPGFFNLTHITNPGAAWGIFAGKKWFLLIISAAAFAGCLVFLKPLTERYGERIAAVFLVCSGIAGNCFDRLFRGEVVDFLEFYIGKYVWPSFNVADSCICVGVFLFLISSFLRPDRKAPVPGQK